MTRLRKSGCWRSRSVLKLTRPVVEALPHLWIMGRTWISRGVTCIFWAQAVIVEDALPGLGRVEIRHVNDAGKPWIFTGDGPDSIGQELAHACGFARNLRPARRFREEEPDHLMVLLHQFQGVLLTAEVFGHAGNLIVKDIGQAFQEYEGQDVILEFRRIHRPPDNACRLLQPILQRAQVRFTVRG